MKWIDKEAAMVGHGIQAGQGEWSHEEANEHPPGGLGIRDFAKCEEIRYWMHLNK